MGKDATKGKETKKAKGKKVMVQELESSPKGPRRKNSTISHPHIPQPADGDEYNDAESSSAEASSTKSQGSEDVDTTMIERHDPPLVLTTAPVLIIE